MMFAEWEEINNIHWIPTKCHNFVWELRKSDIISIISHIRTRSRRAANGTLFIKQGMGLGFFSEEYFLRVVLRIKWEKYELHRVLRAYGKHSSTSV